MDCPWLGEKVETAMEMAMEMEMETAMEMEMETAMETEMEMAMETEMETEMGGNEHHQVVSWSSQRTDLIHPSVGERSHTWGFFSKSASSRGQQNCAFPNIR